MLAYETYYRNGRWWFQLFDKGRLGQNLGFLYRRRCRDKKEAEQQGAAAMDHERKRRAK